MYLVDREEQLRRIEELFTRSAAGAGGVALIEGAMADGKTELLRRAADEAVRSGSLVLRAACSAAEQALPFGVLEQLVRSVRLPAGLSDWTARSLERAVAEAPAGADAKAVNSSLARALRELTLPLLELAERTPVVIAVDDIHQADPLSLHFLLYLVRRLRSSRIAVVLTAGSELADGPEPLSVRLFFRAELLDQPHCVSLRVGPLSAAGALRMARAALGQPGADRLAGELPAAGGGNPALLRALVQDLQSAAGRDGQSGDEAYVRALLSLIYRDVPHGLPRVARALAVLGGDATPGLVAQLVGLEDGSAEQCLRVLTGAGVLSDGGFHRDAARRGILSTLPAPELAALRARASRLLHETGGAVDRVTRLLLSSGLPPEPWAGPVLLESAHRHLLNGEWSTAAATLELALQGDVDERDRAATSTALTAALWQTAPAASCQYLDALASAAQAGHLGARDSRTLLHQLLWHGRHDSARRVLTALHTLVGAGRATHAELLETQQWIAWTCPVVIAGGPRPEAAVHGDLRFRPAILAAHALARGRAGEAVAQAEQALREQLLLPDDLSAVATTLTALTALVGAGRATAAAHWCDRQLSSSRQSLSPTWRALLHAARAEAAIDLGDLHAAGKHSKSALDGLTPASWGVLVGLPLSAAVLAAVRSGRTDDAAALLARPVPAAMFHSRYGLQYLHARGHYHLATGHPHAALQDFQRCGELSRDWGLNVPGVVPWRTAAAEAWLRLGHPEEAAELATAQLALAEDSPADRGRALRVLAASAPVERRVPALTEALELLESCGDQYEPIRVLMDLGEACHRLGDPKRARTHSRRARRMAELHGAVPLREALPQAPSQADPPPADGANGSACLTDSEARVVELAVRGHTNREIATKLFVSASTVEQHLTRVYRKLGVRSRRELPARLPGLPRSQDAGCVLAS